ncbi:hypothetical protein LJK87_00595 [Paenibacillus sp. P25]|nr:hypothetical protein LJK87_00595 [Paenibacillus sp. P25]
MKMSKRVGLKLLLGTALAAVMIIPGVASAAKPEAKPEVALNLSKAQAKPGVLLAMAKPEARPEM